MSKFIINGGKPLSGEVQIYGAKNAVLPLMAATLLTTETVKLENVPNILDVKVMIEILKDLGAKVDRLNDHTVEITAENITKKTLSHDLAGKLRASVLLVGPMLARKGEVVLPFPGGDIIGRRSIETHLEGFKALGAKVSPHNSGYKISAQNLKGAEIYLDERSVTATENIVMVASLARGETKIRFAAEEPHVVDLCQFLKKMGAEIDGVGTSEIIISGVKKLGGGTHSIIPDQIDAVTFAAAAIVTRGSIQIKGVSYDILYPILHRFDKMNVHYSLNDDVLSIRPSRITAANVQTSPWPGFPTDCQPLFTVIATQAKGVSLIHDWMYERRLMYIDELIKMGAEITLCDPHRILISGPTKLRGANLLSPDIRAGVTLVVAALAAEGETVIDHIEIIDRGYEKIEQRLNNLGASIKRVDA